MVAVRVQEGEDISEQEYEGLVDQAIRTITLEHRRSAVYNNRSHIEAVLAFVQPLHMMLTNTVANAIANVNSNANAYANANVTVNANANATAVNVHANPTANENARDPTNSLVSVPKNFIVRY